MQCSQNNVDVHVAFTTIMKPNQLVWDFHVVLVVTFYEDLIRRRKRKQIILFQLSIFDKLVRTD